jgi:hypothetical protein
VSELPPHDHELDGHYHDGCAHCDEAKSRMPLGTRERRADAEARALGQRVLDAMLTSRDLGLARDRRAERGRG